MSEACGCEDSSVLKKILGMIDPRSGCKLEMKLKLAVLESKEEKLVKLVKHQQEQIKFLSDALGRHECCIHVNDKPADKFYERQEQARNDRMTYRSRFLGKTDPVYYD